MRIGLVRVVSLAVGILILSQLGVAQSSTEAGLSLYGIKLKDANASTFIEAAEHVGARRIADEKSLPTFDTRGAGVPSLDRFSLLADGNNLIAVQFTVGGPTEVLRKMLIAKYGAPRDASENPFGEHQKFDAQYLSECRFVWRFQDGMTLVWKQDFFGATVLSYADERKFKTMMARVQQNVDASAVRQAATANANF